MRFGKKLAIQSNADPTGAPYISHGALKTTVERFARELKSPTVPCHASAMDQIFFQILRSDLEHILNHISRVDADLVRRMGEIQRRAIRRGIIYEKEAVTNLAKTMACQPDDPRMLCQYLMELKLDVDGPPIIAKIQTLICDFDNLLGDLQKHTSYIEINVAGFRKLLKQREKQLSKFPFSRHACMPLQDFTWVDLVSKNLRLLLIVATCMRKTFAAVTEFLQCSLPVIEVPQLGSESYTCVQVAKDLQRNMHPIMWMDPT
eukprot:GEMP01076234.1.p1 GENE.GEMP01076234.1~~GEMP01076234.1.p1  ORF type:complete len:274 (+),score=36.29 GEMP01076234.1:40-822(+)